MSLKIVVLKLLHEEGDQSLQSLSNHSIAIPTLWTVIQVRGPFDLHSPLDLSLPKRRRQS
jgi:hypothetical protein